MLTTEAVTIEQLVPFVVLRLTENQTLLVPSVFIMHIFGLPDWFFMLIFGFREAREYSIKVKI